MWGSIRKWGAIQFNIVSIVRHLTFCKLFGFSWIGTGWSSYFFDKNIPEETFKHFWRCSRCGIVGHTFESYVNAQIRFDKYKAKYGCDLVNADEFSPPKP